MLAADPEIGRTLLVSLLAFTLTFVTLLLSRYMLDRLKNGNPKETAPKLETNNLSISSAFPGSDGPS